jgi:two-component sensor histidine kinase
MSDAGRIGLFPMDQSVPCGLSLKELIPSSLCYGMSSVSTEEASWSDFVLTTHVQLSLSIQATVKSRIVVDKGLTNSVAK